MDKKFLTNIYDSDEIISYLKQSGDYLEKLKEAIRVYNSVISIENGWGADCDWMISNLSILERELELTK